MEKFRIDLASDTKTLPSQPMRRAIAAAEVGDEQQGEDPTVKRLCAMVAERLGKERALFLPSGTMCNEIAYKIHCRSGDEIILDRTAHPLHFEAGAPAALSGAMVRCVDGVRGVFSAADVDNAIRTDKQYAPRSRVVSVEQTSNLGGGTVWPLETLHEVASAARRHGLAMHMDGARLFNAVVASGVAAEAFAGACDSVWVDFTKGLGAPLGAVLAGSAEFIEEAVRWKQMFGGALRQAGIVAAACVYALENNVERLAEDHANARLFAESIAAIPGIALEPAHVETNLVFFDVAETGLTAPDVAARLAEHGIRIGAMDSSVMRAVTHLDVSTDGVKEAARLLESLVSQRDKSVPSRTARDRVGTEEATPREILPLGDLRLRAVSEPVSKDDPDLQAEQQALLATLQAFRRQHGFGRAIAAPQIGVAKRMLAMNLGDGPFVLLNPEIIWRSNDSMEVWDDCMCLPSVLVRLKRHRSISVRYLDENFEPRHMEKTDQDLAELLQHEIDHLDGILFTDHMMDKDSIKARSAT